MGAGAWHGSAELKAEVLSRMLAHRAEDSIVQGIYQELDPEVASGYRGCLIGCTLPKPAGPQGDLFGGHWHTRVAELYGIPKHVAEILDTVFEDLEPSECPTFAVASIEAIPVGADLEQVTDRWILALLSDPEFGARAVLTTPAQRQACDLLINLYTRVLAGADITNEERNALATDVNNMLDEDARRGVVNPMMDSAIWGDPFDVLSTLGSLDNDHSYSTRATWGANKLLNLLTDAPVAATA